MPPFLRNLAHSPGFTAVAVMALALGIGANTAIFSVVRAVLLRPLPYPGQERLVVLHEATEAQPNLSLSYPNFLDWHARQRSFSQLGVARSQSFNDDAPGGAERLAGAQVSAELWPTLGVAPLRGRLFTAADDRPGAEPVALIRASYWQRRYGGHESALGEKLFLTGEPHTIVGILPDAATWPASSEVWVPLGLAAQHPSYLQRNNHPGLYAVGRLKPGVDLEAARTDLRQIAAQLAEEHPSNAGHTAALQLLPDRIFGNIAGMLYLLLGAAGFVLLIACANVANLQLCRAEDRAREFAVRAALGATRGRLVVHVLLESLALGAAGSAAGVLLGLWALELLQVVLPANIPRLGEAALDGPVFFFAVTAGVLTSAGFGLIPALHGSRQDLRSTLAATRGSAAHRWRTLLIVAEFGLTCVLLVGAGLMIRTLGKLYEAETGFRTERLLTYNWSLPGATTHADPRKRAAVIAQALAQLAAIPGVELAGVVSPLPLAGSGNNGAFYIEGTPLPEPGRAPWCERAHVSGGYFTTLGITLLAGRSFETGDTLEQPKVAIVDADFAARHFPAGDAVGKRFTYGTQPPASDRDWYRIVGVVAHIRNTGPAGATRLQTYVPFTQLPPVNLTFALRTPLTLATLTPSVRLAIRRVDPTLPVFGESTLQTLFAANIATPRLTSTLLGAFAGLALLLASIGLYGVLGYTVRQRRREISIRLALGASAPRVVRLIVHQGLKLASLGVALGLLAALVLTRLLGRILYGVSPLDPLSFVVVGILLLGIGLLACWLPARRASQVNPATLLHTD